MGMNPALQMYQALSIKRIRLLTDDYIKKFLKALEYTKATIN